MEDTVFVKFPNGKSKEIKLPKYGEIVITIRNGKVALIDTKTSEKIC